jgi:cellulose synthase/poly-beta-1,6-N-acetylglucosamine synthase-like glycosyltransferase
MGIVFAFEIILLVYFSLAVAYALAPSIAGRFGKSRVRPSSSHSAKLNRVAILVPAYKEDQVIVPIAKKLIAQEYPTDSFDVVVIADSLQEETMRALQALPVILLDVQFEKSTKTKSLVYALRSLTTPYDIALICDADNILEPAFLQKINGAYQAGFRAIQAKRVAKNLNTPFAILDATSEIINNHIYRKGYNALGLSSSLIGSGMAFSYTDLLACLEQIDAVGGFDRVLQLYLIERGHTIRYLEEALIFDEKVENSEAFTNQRKRWIASQFVYLRKYFAKGIKALFVGKIDYFNASVLYNIFLPRVINLGLLVILTIASFALAGTIAVSPWIWLTLLAAFGLSLFIAIPRAFFTKKLITALLALPRVFFIMFTLLFKLKGADKKFIHTQHNRVDIDDQGDH